MAAVESSYWGTEANDPALEVRVAQALRMTRDVSSSRCLTTSPRTIGVKTMYATGSAAAVGGTAGVLASTGYNLSTVLIVSAALTVVLGILLLVRSFRRRRNAPTS